MTDTFTCGLRLAATELEDARASKLFSVAASLKSLVMPSSIAWRINSNKVPSSLARDQGKNRVSEPRSCHDTISQAAQSRSIYSKSETPERVDRKIDRLNRQNKTLISFQVRNGCIRLIWFVVLVRLSDDFFRIHYFDDRHQRDASQRKVVDGLIECDPQ